MPESDVYADNGDRDCQLKTLYIKMSNYAIIYGAEWMCVRMSGIRM